VVTPLGELPGGTVSVAFTDPQHGVAAGLSQLEATQDGGRTWTPIKIGAG
jgi:photosystem II stability/assembly factor-like uncharacterized protein